MCKVAFADECFSEITVFGWCKYFKPGIRLNSNKSALDYTAPMWQSEVWCGAISTQHYCKYVLIKHMRSWTEVVVYVTKAIETAKAVHTEHTPNNAHFDGPTTQAKQLMSLFAVCLRSLALSTLPHWGDMVLCGFIRAQVYSRLYQKSRITYARNWCPSTARNS